MLTAFAAILLLSLSLQMILPSVYSQYISSNPPLIGYTEAFLAMMPNPAGVGQSVIISAWVSPPPLLNFSNGFAGFYNGEFRTGYNFAITKPDGTVLHQTQTAAGAGDTYFVFTPDQVGKYTVVFSWAGDTNFVACSTTGTLVVQQDSIPNYPALPTPDHYWTYPVNPMFKGSSFENLIGPWLQTQQGSGSGWGYDSAGTNFNPYTLGPQSSHILWMLPPDAGLGGGLIGGQFGTLYNPVSAKTVGVVISGHAYYNGADGKIHCINDTDGKELWAIPGRFDLGMEEMGTGILAGASLTPYLLEVDQNIVKYNAFTGAVVANVTNAPGIYTGIGFAGLFAPVPGSTYLGFSYPSYVYWRQEAPSGDAFLLKLDVSGTPTSISSMIKWNTTFPAKSNIAPYAKDIGTVVDDNRGILVFYQFAHYGNSFGVNTSNGSILWSKPITTFEQKAQSIMGYNGYFWLAENTNRTYDAFDEATGNIVLKSTNTAYPWGDFWAYGAEGAYGNVYIGTYDGVYAFNADTAKQVWEFRYPSYTNEEPYGSANGTYANYPFFSYGVVADQTLYIPTGEHSPTTIYDGQKLFAIDTNTGKEKWSLDGYYSSVTAVADGKLFASSGIDGNTYCFGQGPSATTVTVSQSVVGKGNSVLIQGAVTDQSPAQMGSPAISDASMSEWMEYLHMQEPKPTNATGVTVALTAVDSSGHSVAIGSATTDSYGNYAYTWTPQAEGTYMVVASFSGSNSYYGSSAETAIGVVQASALPSTSSTPNPSAITTPSPVAPPSSSAPTETYLIVAAATVIIIVVAVAIFAKKHRSNQ